MHTTAASTIRWREEARQTAGPLYFNFGLTVTHVPGRSRLDPGHKRDAEGLIPSERELLDQALSKLEIYLDDTRRMIEMGVKVITGSDSSWGDYRLGNTVYEAELQVHAGYTPMQGVMSVTSWAAAALGMDDKVGTIEPGKEADILVVDGDPSVYIDDLWSVSDVFFAGRKVALGSEDSIAAIRQQPARI